MKQQIEVGVQAFDDGVVMFYARTSLNGRRVSAVGDTEHDAITELQKAFEGLIFAQANLPGGYPKTVEVDW